MAFGGHLQANTAVDLMVGPFVDEDDGKTAETGLTITQAEVRLSKNGGNMAQKNEATSLTHDELGNYVCKLDTTDTNTEGILTIMVHESGALPIKMDYMVLAQAAYISLVTAKDTGFMDINIKTIGRTDTQETETNNLESACSNYSVTRGLTGTAVPAAVADAAGGLVISDAGAQDFDAMNTAVVAIDTLTKAAGDGDLAAVLVDTGTTIPGTITTAQNDLDTITGASGVLIDTDAVDADALKADAVTEIWAKAMSDLAQGAPSATASVLTAINYLYESWRNKTTTTATLITVMKDDGSTGLVKSTISDDATTFSKGEFVSGA